MRASQGACFSWASHEIVEVRSGPPLVVVVSINLLVNLLVWIPAIKSLQASFLSLSKCLTLSLALNFFGKRRTAVCWPLDHSKGGCIFSLHLFSPAKVLGVVEMLGKCLSDCVKLIFHHYPTIVPLYSLE
jgi:hypothetical protein